MFTPRETIVQLRVFLHFFLIMIGACSGCCTVQKDIRGDVGLEEKVKLPIKFVGYQELFRWVAGRTYGSVPADPRSIFNLAADSKIEVLALDDKRMPYLYLVT